MADPQPPPPPLATKSSMKSKLKSSTKKPPGGFDQTPFPPAPPGQTIKITFQRARDLPAADLLSFHTRPKNKDAAAHGTTASKHPRSVFAASSDPFILATLRSPALPRRHAEDPDLTYQTPTMRRTTEPVWDDAWVVANVPTRGFTLKCRIYDEDYPDTNDRLGNVTIRIAGVPTVEDGGLGEEWKRGKELVVKKRSGSKRAYALRGCLSLISDIEMTPRLWVAMEVLRQSDPPHAQMYTVGPTFSLCHYSPMIGRITGTKVNADSTDDVGAEPSSGSSEKRRTQRYDFQAKEMQLSGPVPPELYHRYVAFRPIIATMFTRKGLAGRILNQALHKQHNRIYNFDQSTERAEFNPRSTDAALQFLKLAHFDQGGRLFTYVLTLDGLLRFCETGSEFGIDLLSKHSMHSDVATYIACSGEFFIRRLARSRRPHHHHPHLHHGDDDHEGGHGSNTHGGDVVREAAEHNHRQESDEHEHDTANNPDSGERGEPDDASKPPPSSETHPPNPWVSNGPPSSPPPLDPSVYQLIIDNDSGTYRPDKSILPRLKSFLEENLPGLSILALHWEEERLKEMKKEQQQVKKREGPRVNMVMNRSPSSSSLSSGESMLAAMERIGDGQTPRPAKVERAVEILEHPKKAGDVIMKGAFTNPGANGGSSEKPQAGGLSEHKAVAA